MTNFLHNACRALKERFDFLGLKPHHKMTSERAIDYMAGYAMALKHVSEHVGLEVDTCEGGEYREALDGICIEIGQAHVQVIGYTALAICPRGYSEVLRVAEKADKEEDKEP